MHKRKECSNMRFFASILKALGLSSATMGSQACSCWMLDEPECPKSLIK